MYEQDEFTKITTYNLNALCDVNGQNIIHYVLRSHMLMNMPDIKKHFLLLEIFNAVRDSEAFIHPDDAGDTPLHLVAQYGDEGDIRLILLSIAEKDRIKSLFTKNPFGALPIHSAVRYNRNPVAVQLLLNFMLYKQEKSERQNILRIKDGFDRELLLSAVENRNPAIIALLIDQIAAHCLNISRENALMLLENVAEYNSNKDVIDVLAERLKKHYQHEFPERIIARLYKKCQANKESFGFVYDIFCPDERKESAPSITTQSTSSQNSTSFQSSGTSSDTSTTAGTFCSMSIESSGSAPIDTNTGVSVSAGSTLSLLSNTSDGVKSSEREIVPPDVPPPSFIAPPSLRDCTTSPFSSQSK